MKIEIKELTKSYEDKMVFQDLSLEIPIGKTTVIMGRSGCGKTTLVRILLGLEKADFGKVDGLPNSISVVFQEDRLCTGFSALENIMLVLDVKKQDRQSLIDRICKDAESIGITKEHLLQNAEALSGGMKRRIAILRAMHYDADFLILDEAMQGLDDETKRNTIDYIKAFAKGKTILVVTHNEEEAKQFGGHIIRPFRDDM